MRSFSLLFPQIHSAGHRDQGSLSPVLLNPFPKAPLPSLPTTTALHPSVFPFGESQDFVHGIIFLTTPNIRGVSTPERVGRFEQREMCKFLDNDMND